MRILNDPIMVDGNMAGSLESLPTSLAHIGGYAIQIVWSGTGTTGILHLQTSNDFIQGSQTITNWTTIDSADQALSTDTGSHVWNALAPHYLWVRFIFERTAGTGIMQARINLKGF
jgi:hypothetical protein